MKSLSKKAVGAAAFVTALGGSLVALPLLFDQPAFALDTGAPPAGGQWEHHRPMPGEMIEARLAYAKTALKITDAQTKAWNGVADVLRKQAKERDAKIVAWREKMKDAHDGHRPGIIDRMEMAQKMATERAASLSELIAAAKPLYATLSDDQKQVADRLLHPHHGFGGHGMGHGGPEGHGPDGHGPDGHGPGGPGPAPR